MRLTGIYFTDDEVLALAERLRNLGLDEAAERLTSAYYRDGKEVEIRPVEPRALAHALDNGPASFEALREQLAGHSTPNTTLHRQPTA